jgi:hypothetical protein
MEKLMEKNPLAFARIIFQIKIQNDQTLPYKRGGMSGVARRIPKIRAKADLNRAAMK